MKSERSQTSCVGEPEPKSWDDYEEGCVGTFRGGHEGAAAGAFVAGMRTVFNLLRAEFPPAELCQAAPDLLAACKVAKAFGNHGEIESDGDDNGISTSYVIDAAIAKAEGEGRFWPTPWKVEESKANARLIAAAPDLLAACKATIGHVENQDADYAAWQDIERAMRAALEKAEGRS